MKQSIFTAKRTIGLVLAIVLMLTALIPVQAYAYADELGIGGLNYASRNIPVYDQPHGGSVIGTIYQYESYTVLAEYYWDGYIWVDYSTPNGAKRGYIYVEQDEGRFRSDAPARVIANSNVYYGRNDLGSNYQRAGAVYAGEYVAVIAQSGNWSYVEYNTTSGRKRGYMPSYNLELSLYTPDQFASIYNDYPPSDRENHRFDCDATMTVYAGPTKLYAKVGTVSDEVVYRYGSEIQIGPYHAFYIEYYVTGTDQLKSGFIVY